MPKRERESVSLWHPWTDRPVYKDESMKDKRHKLALWSDFDFTNVDETIAFIGGNNYYAVVNDILDGLEVAPGLLRDKRSTAYLSRTGGAVAMEVRAGRKHGFLIPGGNWGEIGHPTSAVLERMQYVFQTFGYEALTTASLSEKILRSTLPDRSYISRPSAMLRRSLLEHGKGGRIDKKELSQFYPQVYENDMNKAYLYCSQNVPDPKYAPIRFCGDSDVWQDYPASWLEVEMTCHSTGGIQPIQIKDKISGELREPFNGEHFSTWCWGGELEDCTSHGYSLTRTIEGYCFPFMSSFMQQWGDILWNVYSGEDREDIRTIIKSMMVGLPGRFLKQPEKYTLVHESERQKGDERLVARWDKGSSPMSEWLMRMEEDIESTALTPVGSYIVTECRRKLYRDAKNEEQQGNSILRVYIDSITTSGSATTLTKSGKRGDYKVKIYTRVRIEHGRFKGYNEKGELVLKAPGVTGERERSKVISEMELQPCGP